MVSNRLPWTDVAEDSSSTWRRSPAAWSARSPRRSWRNATARGSAGTAPGRDPGAVRPRRLPPGSVTLSELEVTRCYEGFSNATLAAVPRRDCTPEFHRTWWYAYRRVNERFARTAAETAAQGATVWVQDYQLQLVPRMLRRLRPDVTIGFFNHVRSLPPRSCSQLPWRRPCSTGSRARTSSASSVRGRPSPAVRRKYLGAQFTKGTAVMSEDAADARDRLDRARQSYPISIDVGTPSRSCADDPQVQARARESAGARRPEPIFLGRGPLSLRRGIGTASRPTGGLLHDGGVAVEGSVLMQVASPSRERVDSYRQLRELVEGMVGRINGQHDAIWHTAIRYLHRGYPFEEMVALYLAADVMLVTSAAGRDEPRGQGYVAARRDRSGALVLSEFTGAAEQLKQAILVNPHDIDGLEEAILHARDMPPTEARKRMASMRRQVLTHDVVDWSQHFLDDLASTPAARASRSTTPRGRVTLRERSRPW
ncbi:trehalose-6-phosphate synthase [Kocuria rhizophila]|nr:trehalose-6-phosphate synthase [Kocuria rhizophila]